MLIVILNWIYVFLTVFALGQLFAWFVEKVFSYKIEKIDSVLMSGMVIATVYAQIYSLFGGVGLWANVCLMVFCIAVFIFLRKRVTQYVTNCLRNTSVVKGIVVLGLILVWAYFTSRGYMHYDSDLYHGQSIRWIEEYGVVKGLGNLHVRLAYNSASFALSALYSLKFLLGVSLHTMNGFVALLLSITMLKVGESFKKRKFGLADWARFAGIYYLLTIVDEVVAPASDYTVMCVLFFIVIKWLDLIAEKEKNSIVPYALLCVLGVYAVSLKLTAGLVLILVLKPAVVLLKEKKYKEILIFIGMGVCVIAPWLIRTVIISGWLLYPFPAIDLFNVDWKIPKEVAAADAAEIRTWGRALYNAQLVDMPITQWFKNWFATTLTSTEKMLIIADLVSVPLALGIAVWALVKRQKDKLDYLLVMLMVMCSYIFWQCSAPLVRYGYTYVLLPVVLTAGYIFEKLGRDKLICVLLIVIGAYKLWAMAGYVKDTAYIQNYIWQADYGKYEVETYKIGDTTVYYPVSGDRVGYEYFPSSPRKMNITLRGVDIEEGFSAY